MKAKKISVIIPTKNGGALFQLLLAKLREQRYPGDVEIIVVDSGSTDDTLRTARQFQAQIISIPPSSFSHSFARNRGAQAASGDYLLFMVQDALPAGKDWLCRLSAALSCHATQGVAAASCLEYPRADADFFYCYTIHNFNRFLQNSRQGGVLRFGTNSYSSLRQNGQLNNIACLIDKKVFDQYRFRGHYAEDLDLGLRLIRDGHALYRHSSIKVIHSHLRPPYYFIKRAFTDLLTLASLFPGRTGPHRMEPRPFFASLASFQAIIDFSCYNFASARAVFQQPDSLASFFASATQNAFMLEKNNLLKSFASGTHNDYRDRDIAAFLKSLPVSKKQPFFFTQFLLNDFLGFSSRFLKYVSETYTQIPHNRIPELVMGLQKAAACVVGSHLARLYLAFSEDKNHSPLMREIKSQLQAGI